jgi:multidrug resistance efflux pump
MARSLTIPAISLALLAVAAYHVTRHSQAQPALAPPAAPARAPFAESVSASGIVEPWTENVSIGTHVAGVVEEVCVEVGQQVAQGEPLLRIDERQLRAEVAVRSAMLASAEAQLNKLEQQPRPEELPPSAAQVREAEARLHDDEERFARAGRLRDQKVISDEEFTTRRQSLAMTREQLARMRAQDELLRAGAWKPDLEVARVAVVQARAELEQSQTNLERLTVTAPRDGRILQVKVRAGEYVAQPSSSELMILGDVDPLHVRVDIDEADIPRFLAGCRARGYVRGDTRNAVDLEFVRVEPYVVPKKSLTGSNTERVDTRVLQALYAARGATQELFVGQQLDVYIDLKQVSSTPRNRESQSGGAPLAATSAQSQRVND